MMSEKVVIAGYEGNMITTAFGVILIGIPFEIGDEESMDRAFNDLKKYLDNAQSHAIKY